MLVATVEAALHVQVPGEAARLLGVTDGPGPPYWWVEVHSPSARPDAGTAGLRFARALVAELGGRVWHAGGHPEHNYL